jgi:hypothetical protein
LALTLADQKYTLFISGNLRQISVISVPSLTVDAVGGGRYNAR